MDLESYRQGIVEFLLSRPASHFISLAWNRAETLNSAHRDITELFKWIDRPLFGRKYYLNGPTERSAYAFIFENIDSNLHAHGLVDVRDGNLEKFEARCCLAVVDHGERLSRPLPWETVERQKFELTDWRSRVVATGSSRVERIWNAQGAAQYMVKAVPLNWDSNGLLLSQ